VRLLAALLDVGLHELLGVGLQDLVDLVQQVVELRLELIDPLRGGRRLLQDLLGPCGRCSLLALLFSHGDGFSVSS